MTDARIAATIASMLRAGSAVRAGDAVSTCFRLGDSMISLVAPAAASLAAIPLVDAFLPMPAAVHGDYTITVVDDAHAGPPPPFPWPPAWNLPFGAVQAEHTTPCRFALDVHSGSFSAFDPRAREAVVWFHDAEHIPYWAAATPFRLQLSWIADTFDGEMIHAAGVKIDDRVALIVGSSGAGKSSLALAATRRGHALLGDDFLLLRGTQVSCVYRRTKIHDATVALLGGSVSDVGTMANATAVGEKRIIDTHIPHLSTAPAHVVAVFVPRIGDEAGLKSLPAAEAARRTFGPSMQGLLGGSPMTLRRIVRLMQAVPAFEITVGPDPELNVKMLELGVRDADRQSRSAS